MPPCVLDITLPSIPRPLLSERPKHYSPRARYILQSLQSHRRHRVCPSNTPRRRAVVQSKRHATVFIHPCRYNRYRSGKCNPVTCGPPSYFRSKALRHRAKIQRLGRPRARTRPVKTVGRLIPQCDATTAARRRSAVSPCSFRLGRVPVHECLLAANGISIARHYE